MTTILKFLNNKKGKKVLSYLSLISLLIYFFIAISGYASWFPGSTQYFLYSSTCGFVLRAISSLFFVLTMLLCMIVWKKEINFKYLIPYLFIILISFIMLFVTETTYYQLYRTELYGFMASIDSSVSLATNLKMYASFAIDILLGFSFLFILPKSIKSEKMYFALISCFLLIMLYSCLYSFIVEKEYYIYFLKGDWRYSADTIGSIFDNKQQWGIFLAPAFAVSLVSIYIFYKFNTHKVFKILFFIFCIASCVLFAFCSLVAACKTAILCIAVFCFSLVLVGLIYLVIKKKYVYSSILFSLILFVIIGFILFMTIDGLHSAGLLKKIYNYISSIFTKGQTTGEIRWDLVRATIQNFPAVNLFFGFPKGTFDAFVRALIPELKVGLHTGIVIYFGRTGIFGIVLYLIIITIVFRKLVMIWKTHPLFSCLLLSTFISSFVLNLFESEIVFMSASASVFAYNLVCGSLVMSQEQKCNQELANI